MDIICFLNVFVGFQEWKEVELNDLPLDLLQVKLIGIFRLLINQSIVT